MCYGPMSSPGSTSEVTPGDRLVPACTVGPEGFHEKLDLTPVTNMPAFSTGKDGV